jgi:hypothetical protein
MLPHDVTTREGSMKFTSAANAVLALTLGMSAQFAVAEAKPQIPRIGLWEVTTAVTGGKSEVDKICVTEEDLGDWNLFKRFEPECKEVCKIGNGNIDCTSKCKYGKTNVEGKVKGTYDSTVYKMTMQAQSAGKSGSTVTISGRYLAPQCGTIK